jgi:hypothetical protein
MVEIIITVIERGGGENPCLSNIQLESTRRFSFQAEIVHTNVVNELNAFISVEFS